MNVIEIPAYDKEHVVESSILRKSKRYFSGCQHFRVTADEQTRTVICRDCELVIDPFDFVWRIGLDWERRTEFIKDYHKLRAQRHEELVSLNFVKGHELHVKAPPPGSKAAAAWKQCKQALGGQEPVAIRRNGRVWSHVDLEGTETAVEYLYAKYKAGRVRLQLITYEDLPRPTTATEKPTIPASSQPEDEREDSSK